MARRSLQLIRSMVQCCSVNKGINCAKSRHRNQQLKLNMFVAALFQLQVSISFTVAFSSIYLFVTSPTVYDDHERCCDHLNNSTSDIQESMTERQPSWSGLGESDFFYSLTSMFRGIGLLVGSFVAGVLPGFVPFRFRMMLYSAICLVGYLLYANATKGWMILGAQFFGLGISLGLFFVFVIGYLCKTSMLIEESEQLTPKELEETETCRVKSKKGRHCSLKDKFLMMNLLLRNIGWPLGVGISSVLAQFEQTVDQFRWPGWANTFIMVFFSLLFQLVYREVDTEPKRAVKKRPCFTFRKPGLLVKEKCCSCFKLLSFRNVVVYSYLGYAGLLPHSTFAAVDTLLSPALSDHFGFSIVYTSYFILGIMMVSFGSSFVLVSLKSLRVNNRMVLIVSLVMSLFGSMMATDWQAIGQDPCHIQFTNASISSTGDSNSSSFVDGTTLHLVNTSDFSSEEIDSPMYNISDFADICTAGTSDIHECYWNPNSRVTGILCSLCRPVCRAESMSIAFVQFSLGVGLISMAAQLMEMALLGIATDCTATSAHNGVVGMLYTSAGVSLITTPLWCIWIYDFVGKRLFGPMVLWSMLTLLSLVGCITLYKHLGPIKASNKIKKIKIHVKVSNPCEECNGKVSQLETVKGRIDGKCACYLQRSAE